MLNPEDDIHCQPKIEEEEHHNLAYQKCLPTLAVYLALTSFTYYLTWSPLASLIVPALSLKLKDWVIFWLFGLESMGTMDYIFLYDSPTSRANMLGKFSLSKTLVAIEFDTFRFEDVKEQFRSKAAALFPRLRQRLSWKYGGLYWETIPDREYEELLVNRLFVDLKGVKLDTEEDLSAFMCSEMQTRDPYYLPQWRLFLKSDFGPEDRKSSLFIIKIHHSLCDGQGLVSFLSRVADETINFLPPNVRNPSILEKAWMYSGLPVSLVKVAYLFLFNRPDRNPIANGKMSSGLKVG